MKHVLNVECKDITNNRKYGDVTTSYIASLKKRSLSCKLYAVKSVAYVMAVFRVSNQSLL